MYGLKHHVEGEKGLPGNPEAMNSVRYTGRVLLAAGLLVGCVGFSGLLQHGAAFLGVFSVVLIAGGSATLIYESKIQDRISHWGR